MHNIFLKFFFMFDLFLSLGSVGLIQYVYMYSNMDKILYVFFYVFI